MTGTLNHRQGDHALLRLRPVRLEDWPTIHEWAGRRDVTQYQTWGPNSAAETRDYVIDAINAAAQRPQSRYVLSVVSGDRVVGLIELTIRSRPLGAAEFGYAVHPDCWGQGIATAAGRLATDFAFRSLGIRTIHATCDTTNIASVRVLEKLGMRLHATLRRHIWLGDRWRDTHVYSLLAP